MQPLELFASFDTPRQASTRRLTATQRYTHTLSYQFYPYHPLPLISLLSGKPRHIRRAPRSVVHLGTTTPARPENLQREEVLRSTGTTKPESSSLESNALMAVVVALRPVHFFAQTLTEPAATRDSTIRRFFYHLTSTFQRRIPVVV